MYIAIQKIPGNMRMSLEKIVGEFYYLDESDYKAIVDLTSIQDLNKDFYKLNIDGILGPPEKIVDGNEDYKNIRFDSLADDNIERQFSIFLRPDSTVIGRIHYLKDTIHKDDLITGQFKLIEKEIFVLFKVDVTGGEAPHDFCAIYFKII